MELMCGRTEEQLQIDGAKYFCAEASLILDEIDLKGSRRRFPRTTMCVAFGRGCRCRLWGFLLSDGLLGMP